MELLLRNGANVNIRGRSGWYSLHEAAFDGLNNVVQFLIAHGGWINDKTSDGFAAIHLAAQNGKFDCCFQIRIEDFEVFDLKMFKFLSKISAIHKELSVFLNHSFRS